MRYKVQLANEKEHPFENAMGDSMLILEIFLAACAVLGPIAAWGRFLKETACSSVGSDFLSAPFAPAGFPCGGTAWASTSWLLRHPASLFLLTEGRRCVSFMTALWIEMVWCAHLALRGRSFRASQRMFYLSLIRVLPKVANAAKMLMTGRAPTTLMWHNDSGYEK